VYFGHDGCSWRAGYDFANKTDMLRFALCHPERSEGSVCEANRIPVTEILRFAQDDISTLPDDISTLPIVVVKIHYYL
jgi:hypothetical protein